MRQRNLVRLFVVAVMTLAVLTVEQGRAQTEDTPSTAAVEVNDGDMAIYPIDELPDVAEPFVIGGKKVKPADFPSSFYVKLAGSRCTATLIGPKVLLTAAHCVGANRTVKMVIGGKAIRGK